jgi:ADP-heptose:LPS heptosyltransferase
MRGHVLAVRLDSDGDVILTGPAIRAIAQRAEGLTLLCGPRGFQAAGLLPGVDRILVHRAPWIDPEPEALSRRETLALVRRLAALAVDEAIIFTSFHQSALPTALLLRLAGVPKIAAISEDYAGSLLDVRHRIEVEMHEVERSLRLAATLGYELAAGADDRLLVERPGESPLEGEPYIVVHPGASVPARTWPAEKHAALVHALAGMGWRVVVTGGHHERKLTAFVAGAPRPEVEDLGGLTTLAELADVLAEAAVVVVGNTGPAHLAAAVGTPVVSLFAPVVPAIRWRPWRVPHVLLGDQRALCAGSRARTCSVPGHPCLESVSVEDVVAAIATLAPVEEAVPA